MWRTTLYNTGVQALRCISIHVLRVEDDATDKAAHAYRCNFNPRPPCGGRLTRPALTWLLLEFNPRPPCGGRLFRSMLAKSDVNFNPRPPCGGRHDCRSNDSQAKRFQSTSSVWRTTDYAAKPRIELLFQSTSSVWRTTNKVCDGLRNLQFQSTSSVWRTTARSGRLCKAARISIHVLRVEDDIGAFHRGHCATISIHVLRVEDDGRSSW